MAVSKSSVFIKKQAREVLSKLYCVYYDEKGKYLSPDEFFPINLKKIISSVMDWNLESLADIGYDSYGQRLRGHCDYEKKLIRISFQDIKPGEKVFTIAHEIGHALLHTHAPRTSSVSERKRVTPRIAKANSNAQERKMEKEANIFAAELLMPEKAVRDYFFSVFGRKELWLGSMKAQQIIKNIGSTSRTSIFTPQTVKDIAPYFSDYKKTGTDPSMREFFGVSRSAMSLRLLELSLLYE
jgi:Zn-dependent peptidase ImmA (M78 family)